jgi:hypothetical protein
MDVRDREAVELLHAILDELRALRDESARQTSLLDAMLAKLGAIERTQYS